MFNSKKFYGIVTLFIATTLYAENPSPHFKDLSSANPNFEAINYIKNQNIISGYPDGTFKPTNDINRAELTKIIVAMNYEPDVIAACDVSATGLSDVPTDAWFAPYICTAKEKGIVKGYDDKTFRPANNINLAEASKIIGKAVRPSLSDGSDIWFRPYMEYFSTKKALPVSVESFEQLLNRGEVSEIIYRLKAEVLDKPSVQYGEGNLLAPEVPGSTNTNPVAPAPVADSNAEYTELSVESLQQAMTEKKKIVLFFHAGWCPSCVKADAEIKDSIGTFPANTVVLKANYDKETELRKKFEITQQHTAVVVDENNQLKEVIPGFTIEQLKTALK